MSTPPTQPQGATASVPPAPVPSSADGPSGSSAQAPARSSSPTPARTTSPPLGWLPHPALSVLLATVWLLLQQSLAVPQLITAVVLGLVVPRLVHGFIGDATHPRSAATILRFGLLVVWDIVVSNLVVARIVLSPRSNPQPAWVVVPLDTQHPTAISLLATIITMTPGTVSSVVDDYRGHILVHALDCSDPPALVAQIKDRYERPLLEIFG